MRAFRKLRVWQDGHAFALSVHRLTSAFPPVERYSLTAQLRRAALSVPANIAEGSKRESQVEFVRFINIAEGSLAEAQYLLLFSRDLGYVGNEALILEGQAEGIARQLHALKTAIRRQHP